MRNRKLSQAYKIQQGSENAIEFVKFLYKLPV
jgi:hypothetical protein